MDILKSLADNKPLSDALKELLVRHFNEDDARLDGITDEQLGQMYRARLVGLRKIDDVFREIATHKSRQEVPKAVHPGR